MIKEIQLPEKLEMTHEFTGYCCTDSDEIHPFKGIQCMLLKKTPSGKGPFNTVVAMKESEALKALAKHYNTTEQEAKEIEEQNFATFKEGYMFSVAALSEDPETSEIKELA